MKQLAKRYEPTASLLGDVTSPYILPFLHAASQWTLSECLEAVVEQSVNIRFFKNKPFVVRRWNNFLIMKKN